MARIIPIPIGPIFPGGPCRGIIHVIQKGDTLYQLGKRYHVSVGQLMFANPFVDVYNLQIGDELCIPATIQPRNVGAGERQEYGDINDWNDQDESGDWNDRNDWNDGEDWDGRDDGEDWNDREDWNDGEDWNDRDDEDNWNSR